MAVVRELGIFTVTVSTYCNVPSREKKRKRAQTRRAKPSARRRNGWTAHVDTAHGGCGAGRHLPSERQGVRACACNTCTSTVISTGAVLGLDIDTCQPQASHHQKLKKKKLPLSRPPPPARTLLETKCRRATILGMHSNVSFGISPQSGPQTLFAPTSN
jgi:hypothetical protein